ncbi:MAG TPA: flagellar biosynthetic protein FliO [Kofleriaceae bacterium]
MPGNGAAAGASYGDLLITSLLVLGAVCVAAYIAVRVFGRLIATGRARGAHLLDVVARVPLEPRRSLYVVEVAGKTLLVGTSEMGLSVLTELDGSEVKSRVAAQQSFGELVRAAWERRKARRAGEASAVTQSAVASSVSSASDLRAPGASASGAASPSADIESPIASAPASPVAAAEAGADAKPSKPSSEG